jgi:hypothetical protein
MQSRRIRAAALIALAAGAIAVPVATAEAAPAPIVGGASFAQTAPFIDGTIYAFECHATAPGAVSTSIDSCSLNSYGASPSTSSGPVAGTSAAIAVPVTTYRVCWTASARYSDGTSQSTSGCTISSSVGGAGAG